MTLQHLINNLIGLAEIETLLCPPAWWLSRKSTPKPVLANQIEMKVGANYLVRVEDKPSLLRYQGRADDRFMFEVGPSHTLYARADQIFGALPVVVGEKRC